MTILYEVAMVLILDRQVEVRQAVSPQMAVLTVILLIAILPLFHCWMLIVVFHNQLFLILLDTLELIVLMLFLRFDNSATMLLLVPTFILRLIILNGSVLQRCHKGVIQQPHELLSLVLAQLDPRRSPLLLRRR